MLITIPKLGVRLRTTLEARLDSIERLVADAQHVTGIEVVIVVEEQLDHVAVSVLAGDDAVVEAFGAAPWACWFMGGKPWVPLLIVDLDGVGSVSFASITAAAKPDHCLRRHRHRRGDLR